MVGVEFSENILKEPISSKSLNYHTQPYGAEKKAI